MGIFGVGSVVAGPKVLEKLGFTRNGITKNSWAASWMSSYGGNIKKKDLFSELQAMGGKGKVKASGISYLTKVCEYLCDLTRHSEL